MKSRTIRPSCSPYSAPIVPIRKKDSGSSNLCGLSETRQCNSFLCYNAYPAPRIDEIFEQLGDAEYISRLDMSKGYFQVPLLPQSQEKSAFVTPFGQFEFTVMPFGMDKLLNDLENTVAYFDDIVVYSKSWEHLKQLFQRLAEEGITVRPTKCELGAKEIVCLGLIVGGGNI